MRNRLLPILLLAAVALIALYSRRSGSPVPPASSSAPSAERTESPSSPVSPRAGTEAAEPSRNPRGNHSRTEAQPGAFDFYLLNLSWSPEFCATHAGKPECAAHPGFVLHGLWPQNTDGTYPEDCSTAPGPSDPGAFKDILPDGGLLAHEWQTHGTCSGLSADSYFVLARNAVHKVIIPPSLAGLTSSASRTPDAILADFRESNASFPAESFALSCGHNYLTAVEVCLNKSLAPIACSAIRSCRANTVIIVPPGGAN